MVERSWKWFRVIFRTVVSRWLGSPLRLFTNVMMTQLTPMKAMNSAARASRTSQRALHFTQTSPVYTDLDFGAKCAWQVSQSMPVYPSPHPPVLASVKKSPLPGQAVELGQVYAML